MDNHLLTVNVEKAKKRIKKLQNQISELQSFIDDAENYHADSFQQKVIKIYAFEGSIGKVTERLNTELLENGEETKLKTNDIIVIIDSNPIDTLHKLVRKIYRTNKKNTKEKKDKFRYY